MRSGKSRRLFTILVLAVGLVANAAHADAYVGKVNMLETWQAGNVAFTLVTTVTTCNQQFILNASWLGTKNFYAMLLAAKAADRYVTVYTSGCGVAEGYPATSYNLPIYIQIIQ